MTDAGDESTRPSGPGPSIRRLEREVAALRKELLALRLEVSEQGSELALVQRDWRRHQKRTWAATVATELVFIALLAIVLCWPWR